MFRCRAKLIVISLACCLVFTAGHSICHAQAKTAQEAIKVAATASKIDDVGKQAVTVTITMEKGWAIYANPVISKDLAHYAARVSISADATFAERIIHYPAGILIEDKDLIDIIGAYAIYKEKAVITASVTRAAGDTSPIEVEVRLLPIAPQYICQIPRSYRFTLPTDRAE